MPNYTKEEGKIIKLFIRYAYRAQPKIERFLGIKFDWYITLNQIKIGAGADRINKIIYFGKDGIVGAYHNCEENKTRCFKFVARFLMLHEALHISGLSHDKEGRKLGYRTKLDKDLYTRKLIRKIFGYTKEEVPD